MKLTTLIIDKILVLERSSGMDIINVTFKETVISPIYPFEEAQLSMEFKAAASTGQDYVRKHFKIEPQYISIVE